MNNGNGVKTDGAGEMVDEWYPPDTGWVKINSDRACNLQHRRAVVDIVARNKEGIMINGLGKVVETKDPEIAKALAIKIGMKLAVEKRF